MLESWFLYAIGSFFVVGIYWFLQKVEAESTLNTNSFIVYAHLGCIISPLVYVLFTWEMFYIDYKLLLFGIGINLLYVLWLQARIKSLRSLSSSSFFINYRIGSSALLIIFGQLFFWENITLNEYIGIFLGFIIFYLLLEKKEKKSKKKKSLQWYVYLMIWIFLITVIWLLMKKYILMSNGEILTYVLSAWIAGIFGTLLMKWRDSISDVLIVKKRKHILFLVFTTIIFTSWIFLNLSAVASGWDLAIVYKILSYSLFIPIILSVIVYKEKIWIRQIIAFILTIISILLFI